MFPAFYKLFTNHAIRYVPFVFFILFMCLGAAAQVKPVTEEGQNKKSLGTKAILSYKIITAEQNTFGYDILQNDKPFVHQPSIPGLPGNRGFIKRDDAEKCAELVIYKINKNILPPTVTKQEMDSLKIKF